MLALVLFVAAVQPVDLSNHYADKEMYHPQVQTVTLPQPEAMEPRVWTPKPQVVFMDIPVEHLKPSTYERVGPKLYRRVVRKDR